jgi:hypothetical protein
MGGNQHCKNEGVTFPAMVARSFLSWAKVQAVTNDSNMQLMYQSP